MVPGFAPSTSVCQTPLSVPRIGWRRGSQPLKSPTTATEPAFGAHTAKRVPPATGCAPSFS
jgi:hypothetical protein